MNFFLGQIGIYGFNFPPRGWALCSGTILPISQNTALYSLIGTIYGGDGQTTLALPDLRSRTPIGFGQQTSMGEMAGTETVTLLSSEMPAHSHAMAVSDSNGTVRQAANNFFAHAYDSTANAPLMGYVAPAPNVMLNERTVSLDGGSQPHANIQPCLAVNFCIATTGFYPSRN